MEIVSFLNNQFWGDSSYMVLLTISLILMLWNKKKNTRAKMVAVYSILVLFLIIYNPFVAPYGLHFFAEDQWAYMRIFYLLPLMPVIAYALTDYYADKVDITEKPGRKAAFLAVIILTVLLCGQTFGSSMYIKAQNIYKVDGQALTLADTIKADSGAEKIRVLLPANDNIIYGIRQYEGDIIVAGNSDTIKDEMTLYTAEQTMDFSYVVIGKDEELLRMFEKSNYENIASTDDYYIMCKRGN